MKKILVIFIIIMVALVWFWPKNTQVTDLVTPNVLSTRAKPTPEPTSVPINAPKTFKFDRTTDLKMELDSINPQVLDSDFE